MSIYTLSNLGCSQEHPSILINSFLDLVSKSPFFPESRHQLFAKGLYAGLFGDFYTSTHILIPQIENSICHLLEQRGIITSRLDNGIQKDFQLAPLLNMSETKSIWGEDIVFDLQGLLTESSGDNLRNKMAHGLLDDSDFQNPTMSYLWWISLRLCFSSISASQELSSKSNPWVKFAGMFKEDPLFEDFIEEMNAYRYEINQKGNNLNPTSREQASE